MCGALEGIFLFVLFIFLWKGGEEGVFLALRAFGVLLECSPQITFANSLSKTCDLLSEGNMVFF